MATSTAATSYDTPPATCTPSITSPPTILSATPTTIYASAPVRNTVSGDENPDTPPSSPPPHPPPPDSSSSATTAKKKSQNLFLFCWQAVCHPLLLVISFQCFISLALSPSLPSPPLLSVTSLLLICFPFLFLPGPKWNQFVRLSSDRTDRQEDRGGRGGGKGRGQRRRCRDRGGRERKWRSNSGDQSSLKRMPFPLPTLSPSPLPTPYSLSLSSHMQCRY